MDTVLIIGLGVILTILLFILLKFRKDVVHVFKILIGKVKRIKIQCFTIPIAVVLTVIICFVVPDKYYYFIFTGIFTVGLYMLIKYLMDYIYVVSLNWNNDSIQFIELSTRAFNNYKIIDEDGKNESIRLWLKCKTGRIALVDDIDVKNKVIVLNPTVSNFEFTKNYKKVDMMIKKRINQLTNELAQIEGEMEYKTVLKAKQILENSSLLSTIAGDNIKSDSEKTDGENKEVKKESNESGNDGK